MPRRPDRVEILMIVALAASTLVYIGFSVMDLLAA
jgi:hypothetical protein